MASSQGDVRSSPPDGIPSGGAAAAKTPARYLSIYGQTRTGLPSFLLLTVTSIDYVFGQNVTEHPAVCLSVCLSVCLISDLCLSVRGRARSVHVSGLL